MPSTVQGSLALTTNFQQTLATVPGSPTVQLPQRLTATYSSAGTAGAADQADLKHSKTYVFVASTPQTIDLTAAVDAFGTVNFARIRSITVRIYSTTDGVTLTLGAAGSNPFTGMFTGTVIVFAGTANNQGFLVLTAPNTTGGLVSGTSKMLKLDPGTGVFNADVEITGCSA